VLVHVGPAVNLGRYPSAPECLPRAPRDSLRQRGGPLLMHDPGREF
jgi:hypothetical protein